ncbi:uncharacterized protein LOC132549276 [Ylistrum balloti]|uniref:uncharacterized protein LOC132549276 n=1 Tax=Ylistrum balloti TaxID=509963 RepID=UPI002905B0EC|nr:uncharacterized protein LOC132549276 [Ylistrum balloti]
MVYKTCKSRVRSGNTLRTSNSRDRHLYRRQSYLIRQSTNGINETILEDLGFDKDDVAYSLNKKGRWLVPQILKHEFKHNDANIKMDLVESHKLKRKTKCTGFHSNSGFLRKVLPKGTYFNASSLQNKTSASTVTVNIVTPCPTTSSLAHNPKYLDFSPTPTQHCDKESNPPKSRANTRRRGLFEDMTLYEQHDEFDYSEDEDENFEINEDGYKRPNEVYVGDIIVHSNDMQKLLFEELELSKPEETSRGPYHQQLFAEGPWRKEDEEAEEYLTNLASSVIPIAKHLTFFIPNTEVLTGHLEETFGEHYIECHCFPRKFIIDITDRVTKTLMKAKAFHNRDMNRVDLSTLLIFAYDMFGSFNSTDTDSFKVSINMKTSELCLKINTLPENDVFGIEEIIQGAVAYIESIPYDNFVQRNTPTPYTRPENTSQSILKLPLPDVTVFTPETISIKDMLKEAKKKCHESTGSFESLPPDTCSVCFESILESSATALQACGHWFCDRCWNDHVTSAADGITGSISCPEYKCKSLVDFDILLTTSNLQIVEKVFRRRLSTDIAKRSDSKWCPNKKCGRVVKCEKHEIWKSTNVTCECGTEFCFDCLQSVHWPLSCRDHDKYLEKLKEHGHIERANSPEEVFTFTLRGKRCPVCNVFMEKKGGCLSMYCICGTNFCWGCRTKMELHPPESCFNGDMYTTEADNFRTRKFKLVHKSNYGLTSDMPDWYKRAVTIRKSTNPSRVKVMTSAVRTMCRALTSYKRRKDNDIGAELVNFEVQPSNIHTSSIDKIHPFLTSMISVNLEASRVVEYTTVFLEKSRDQNLAEMRDRLQRLTKDIFRIFSKANNLDLKSSISRLFHLRIECEKIVKDLVNYVE